MPRNNSLNPQYQLTESDLKEAGIKPYPLEEFRPVSYVPGWFVSNFARIISKRSNQVKELHTVWKKGRETIATYQCENGEKKSVAYDLRKLVADAFVPIPDWVKPGDTVQIHHIREVNKEERDITTHYASNLMRLPVSVHNTIHSIALIEVYAAKKFQPMDFISAAEKLDITPYELDDIIRTQPQIKDGVYTVYNYPILHGKKVNNLIFRLIYNKDLRKIPQN